MTTNSNSDALKRARGKWAAKNPAYYKQWRADNRPRLLQAKRKWKIETRYGISIEQYQAKIDAQNGVCAICTEPPTGTGSNKFLHLDHCHTTGKLREMLCHRCNMAIGQSRENPEVLEKMAAYLRKHKE